MASITRRIASWSGTEHPGAQLQPGDKTLGDRAKDALRSLPPARPHARAETAASWAAGPKRSPPRTTASGTSGQPDSCWHDQHRHGEYAVALRGRP